MVEETESCKVQSLVSFKWTGRLESNERTKGKEESGRKEGSSCWVRRGSTYTPKLFKGWGIGSMLRSCQPPSTTDLKKADCNSVCVSRF